MAIALKEANETEYGILLLRETNYLTSQEADSILNDTKELLKLLTSIIKSAIRNGTGIGLRLLVMEVIADQFNPGFNGICKSFAENETQRSSDNGP